MRVPGRSVSPPHQVGHLGVEAPVALLPLLQGLQVRHRHLDGVAHLELLLLGGTAGGKRWNSCADKIYCSKVG